MIYQLENIFTKCKRCGEIQETESYTENLKICQKCGFYGTLTARERLDLTLDEETFEETYKEVSFCNPINFPGYLEKYELAKSNTGLNEAVITGKGKIEGIPVMIAVMDSNFMMGSMGSVVGEKITLLFEEATANNLPVIIFSASGGARMQEGIMSLMQMAKTATAVAEFSKNGGVYISVLTNPTTGGVSASFSFLGDIILAEPNALIGFAGRRVIKQTIRETLPKDFQTAEYLLNHGFIDNIVERKEMKKVLANLLKLHNYKK